MLSLLSSLCFVNAFVAYKILKYPKKCFAKVRACVFHYSFAFFCYVVNNSLFFFHTFDEFLLRHLASTADSDLYTAVGFNWLNAQDASGRPHLQGPFDASFPGPNIEIEFMFNCSNRIIIGTKTKKKSSTIRELLVVSGSKVIHRLSYPTEWIELESEVSNWFTNPPFVSGCSLFKVGTNKLCQVYVFVVNFQDCIQNASSPPKLIWKKHEQIIIRGRPPAQPRRAPAPPPSPGARLR